MEENLAKPRMKIWPGRHKRRNRKMLNSRSKILFVPFEDLTLQKGSTTHIKEFVRALRKTGKCKVILVTQGKVMPDLADEFVSLGSNPLKGNISTMVYLPVALLRVLYYIALYHSRVDIIYTRSYFVCPLYLLIRVLFLSRKTVVYDIKGLASEEWLMKGDRILRRAVALTIKVLERFAVRQSDRVVVITEGLRQYLVSNLGIEPEKIAVIPNGVNTAVFRALKDSGSLVGLRASLGIPKDDPVVLFAGNLSHWQGIDTLLDSIPIVLKTVPPVRFLIVGDGTLRGHLETRIRTMSLEKHVLFTGMVLHEQVPRYINLADVCVSPKRNYPSGLSLFTSPLKVYEYLACGKAVVSSRVAGLEFIEEKETGVLVDPENPEALAEGIVTLLRDPLRRAHMGRNGVALARAEFDWKKRAYQFLGVVRH